MSEPSGPTARQPPSADASLEQPSHAARVRISLENTVIEVAKRDARRIVLSTLPVLAAFLADIALLATVAVSIFDHLLVVLPLLIVAGIILIVLLFAPSRTIRAHGVPDVDKGVDLRWIEDRELRSMIQSLSAQQAHFRRIVPVAPEVSSRG